MAAAPSPQHATLVASSVKTIDFEQDYERIEVLNVDGAAAVYFRIDRVDPALGATGSHVLPAAIGAVELRVDTAGPTQVRLISSGTPKVSVRGIGA